MGLTFRRTESAFAFRTKLGIWIQMARCRSVIAARPHVTVPGKLLMKRLGTPYSPEQLR